MSTINQIFFHLLKTFLCIRRNFNITKFKDLKTYFILLCVAITTQNHPTCAAEIDEKSFKAYRIKFEQKILMDIRLGV